MKTIEIDEFTRIKSLSNPTFSPDGKTIAFTVSQANKEDNDYKSYIYVKKGNQITKLTSFGKEGSFQFIDNTTLLFTGNRKPSESDYGTKFYTIDINGGEALESFSIPATVTKYMPLKNGDALFLAANNPLFPNESIFKDKEQIKKLKEYQKKNADYEILDEVPFYFNGMGFTHDSRTNLYYHHVKENAYEQLTPTLLSISDITLSKDESFVLFSGNDAQIYRSFEKASMYQLDLTTKECTKIISGDEIRCHGFFLKEDGFLTLGNKSETGMNTDPDFYFYSFKDKTVTLEHHFAQAVGSSVGADIRHGGGNSIKMNEDGTLYFISTRFDGAYLYAYKNKKIRKVIGKDGSCDSFDVYGNKLVMVGLYDMKAQELYDEKGNQLTHFNDYLNDYYVAQPEYLEAQSTKDIIHGFVLKPKDYEAGKKYPVILDIHGGPKTVYGPVFYHEMQYWCNKGYFVIYCNPTGSDGRGRRFADIRGKYGTIDYEDIMNFCDEALKQYPDMDATNFFETGGSYGGFMTNWIIGHTDRFKACASQRSIANWVSFYGVSDIGPGFADDQTAGNPFTNMEKMWFHSPLKYAANVKTPTLFIHSNEDYRCPMAEGMQMYTALIVHQIPSKLVYFKGENHELSRGGKPIHRIKRLEEITAWFDKYNTVNK